MTKPFASNGKTHSVLQIVRALSVATAIRTATSAKPTDKGSGLIEYVIVNYKWKIEKNANLLLSIFHFFFESKS